MSIKSELIYKELTSEINNAVKNILKNTEIDFNEIAQTKALSALSEIQQIIRNNDYDDFEAIEKIVCVFEKYNISAGIRHDFG